MVNVNLGNLIVFDLAIDPEVPTTLYAGTNDGIYKSTNGGSSWDLFSAGLTAMKISTLAIDPAIPTTLYAGTATGGVFAAIQQNPYPALAVDYTAGLPGSSFTITGSNFPHNRMATVVINENRLGVAPTDSTGNLVFSLKTYPTTAVGLYNVTVTCNLSAETHFLLDLNSSERQPGATGIVFDVPDGITYPRIFLPFVNTFAN